MVHVLAISSISAQSEFYVELCYFKVKSEYANEFIETEKNFFSKIHKARIDLGIKQLKKCGAYQVTQGTTA